MRTYPDPTHTVHLLTRQEASDPDQAERDQQIADGMRTYQQLQMEFDRELFSTRDVDILATLMQQKDMVRERLAAYGIKVRP
jgi:hypothetical protein